MSVLVACGDNTVDDGSGVRSGDRLRATYLVSGDARRFEGFHDRARDEDCAFSLGAGQTVARCLPASTIRNGYMDAQCTVPAFYRSETGCDTPTPYVAEAWDGCGGGVARLWKVGPLQRPAQIYARDAGGNCISYQPGTNRVWYAAVEEVPLDAFVAAEVRQDDAPGRLKPRYLHGADGSRQELSPFDSELGVTCDIGGSYGQLACHPDVSEGGWLWTDATCTTSLVEPDLDRFPACAGPTPPYAAIWRIGSTNGCAYTREVYRMGDPVPATGRYFGMGGTCQPDTDADRELYALGEELPFESLPTATRVSIGGGRIRTSALEVGGLRRAEYGFFDDARGVPCTPALARDGMERCLPSSPGTIEYYATPLCGVPRLYAVDFATCEKPLLAPADVTALDYTAPVVACGNGNYGVLAAGAEVMPGTIYQRDENNACVPYTWERDEMRVYELGAEILPREFAAFEHVVE